MMAPRGGNDRGGKLPVKAGIATSGGEGETDSGRGFGDASAELEKAQTCIFAQTG